MDVWKAPQTDLEDIRDRLDAGERPNVHGPLKITYHFDDEQGEDYARVTMSLPDDSRIFAEIEDETYGQLKAVRIYIPWSE